MMKFTLGKDFTLNPKNVYFYRDVGGRNRFFGRVAVYDNRAFAFSVDAIESKDRMVRFSLMICVSNGWPKEYTGEEIESMDFSKAKLHGCCRPFVREQRYVVLKKRDVDKYLSDNQKIELRKITESIRKNRLNQCRPELECAVIESDWPIYDQAWNLIEDFFDGDLDE